MIFVTVGTNEARFDRLLDWIAHGEQNEALTIQHGHSSALGPKSATLVDFLSFDELGEAMRRARVVVTHAGVGSIMVALANGKRPIVVPRRHEFGEAVDDHQLQLARRFGDAGLVTVAETPDALRAALDDEQQPAAVIPATSTLAADVRAFLTETVVGTAAPAPA